MIGGSSDLRCSLPSEGDVSLEFDRLNASSHMKLPTIEIKNTIPSSLIKNYDINRFYWNCPLINGNETTPRMCYFIDQAQACFLYIKLMGILGTVNSYIKILTDR